MERVGGVRPGRAVAFASAGGGADRVVVVLEPDGTVAANALVDGVRREVADLFGLFVDDVVVVRNGTVSRTTSGKVQRAATRERYERGELTSDAGQTSVRPR